MGDVPTMVMSEVTVQPERRSGMVLSDALIIALLTFSGYCYVFAYEAGYCDLYHIPWYLISLNLTTGLVAAVGIAGATLSFVYYWSSKFHSALFKNDSKAREYAYFWTATFVSSVLAIRTWNPLALILLNAFLWIAVRPLVIKWKTAKPEAFTGTAPNVVDELFSRLSPSAHLVVALALMLLVVAYATGRSSAKTDPKYIISENHAQYIVLRIYGDNIIAAPISVQKEPYQVLWWRADVNAIVVHRALHFFKVGDSGLPSLVARDPSQAVIAEAQEPTLGGFWGWLTPYRP